MSNESNPLVLEWQTLQNNIEAYERGALGIKLSAVALTVVMCIIDAPWFLLIMTPAMLWLQEGIYRTSQARLGERILRLEVFLSHENQDQKQAFRLHSEWQANRSGTLGLLREYAANSLRPTVAFPYALLILIGLLNTYCLS